MRPSRIQRRLSMRAPRSTADVRDRSLLRHRRRRAGSAKGVEFILTRSLPGAPRSAKATWYFLSRSDRLDTPQDLKYKGEPSELLIGNRNTIREYVSASIQGPQAAAW